MYSASVKRKNMDLSEAGIWMRLFVVRHGETDYNRQRRYTGSTDIPLNENGIRQAAKLINAIQNQSFDIIVSSSMLRARQTAEIIQKSLHIPLVLCDQFAERNFGVYEGLTREEAMRRYPDLWERQCTNHPDDAPTGGETINQILSRVSQALDRLKEAYPNDKVLLVCHSFVSRAVNKICTAASFDEMLDFKLGNCEMREYTV